MAQSRSRIPTALAAIIVLAGAGGLSWWAAQSATVFIETRSREDVKLALATAGQDWVQVSADGLQVHLTGTAPSEVERFRALTQAAIAVDSSRIVDDMTVASVEALTPPDFKIELLRDSDGISLIGLVPASTDRTAILRNLKSETAAPKITDLLESADYAVPEDWDDAIAFGLQAAQMAARAKISIAPGEVRIAAIADSRAEKGRIETELKRARPEKIDLTTDISAPRPVIAPFTLRFLIDEEGARFDACAADNEDGRARILDAAVRAGAGGKPGCTLGLGAPTQQWADAVVPAIEAVAGLGLGSVTISDADIALIAPASVEEARFDEVVGQLERALPPVFSLQARRERAEEAEHGPPEFVASLVGDSNLSMRGRIADEQMREAVDSFARSRFLSVQSSLSSDDDVPGGWTVRVIGALEAMDNLASGTAEVSPDLIRLSGVSGDPDAAERTAATLADRLGPGARYDLSIRYDRRLDPALDLPDGEECIRQLNIILSESEIGFEPSKSTIAGDPAPTLERIAGVMTNCTDFRLEAGGHTDAQGSEGFNADLSRARAQALVVAMTEAGIDTVNMTARGYGESQPIAGNDSEEGREENRRIEFRLLSDHPVRSQPLAEPVRLAGVTRVVPAGAAAADAPAPTEKPEGPVPTALQFEGPPVPTIINGPLIAPATVGVSEEFLTLDEREENITLPVQTPDENTPRPEPRPEDEAGAAQAEGSGDIE
ncbi:OmpA family protein [Paracoccus marinaquae]|uniref:OmpA family protein n=1 Tax=Paracoccus marinaquae TaxID=2841926 RepID=A0ABS6AL67_9RHOB|nr:OmpA family protein [Paracoccus marinaquae]MBU3030852.1 OmpA family protein [Paracoccus marinaquae]